MIGTKALGFVTGLHCQDAGRRGAWERVLASTSCVVGDGAGGPGDEECRRLFGT
jgi:hypothetical protein